MKTSGMTPIADGANAIAARERVEALADSALNEQTAQAAIDELLASPELMASWNQVHRIGDYLRSEEMGACEAEPLFWQNFAKRLEQEPTLLAPQGKNAAAAHLWSRYGLPGLSVAAAVAVMSWLILPGVTTNVNAPLVTASRQPATIALQGGAPLVVASVGQGSGQDSIESQNVHQNSKPVDVRVLRNYLAAHQQFSASVLHGPGSVQSASFNTIRSDDSAHE